MADEKHVSRGSNSISKKDKLKKVPQRGLGIVQLEKMRLEQEKTDSIDISNFRPPFPPSPNSIPLPLASQTNLASPNALFRHTPLVSGSEIAHHSLLSKAILGPRYGDWSTFSNGEFDLEGESRMLDSHGLAFQPRVSLSYDTNASVLPLPSARQILHQSHSHQLLSSSSSMTLHPSPSSVLSYRMELPSNQNFRSNNYIPLYPEEDKMVGMKRVYPFSLETPPAPSFNGNFHSTYSASLSKSEELISCSNRYTVHPEPRNKHIREGPSNSSPLHETNHSEVTTDTGMLHGDFLSLAPPMAVPLPGNSNSKHARSYSSQENSKSQIQGSASSGLVEQSFFNFYPIKLHDYQPTTKDETIDLNLKL